MGTRRRPIRAQLLIALAILVGCTKPPMRTSQNVLEPPEAPAYLPRPTQGGPLVRIGRVDVPALRVQRIRPNEHEELFVIVESGDFGRALGWPQGAIARVESEVTPVATTPSSVIVVVVRDVDHPFAHGESPVPRQGTSAGAVIGREEAAVLSVGDGKLRVQIFHDAQSGARLGALGRLDADAELDVPEHIHESSVEALFIESGNGTMILGDERFPIAPGEVIYIPAGVRHGYVHGSEPLRAWQIYAPPGPEQRFRGPPPAG